MRYWLVMPAAGSGRRFGGAPKQHHRFDAGTLLEAALQPFLTDERCRGGALVMRAGDAEQAGLRARLPAQLQLVTGGSERAHSVLNGLQALTLAADDWVLVHDAARPCLSAADLERLLTAVAGHAVGGLLAVPVGDTVKQSDEERHCLSTLARERLWLAQTPQMFRYLALRRALEHALAAGRLPTDEAQALEWQGARPLLVEARDGNIKVTTAVDLIVAESILRSRRGAAP
jgi:2-C-methyl-D-erythritol 4-phosphate cytidylyltransferase